MGLAMRTPYSELLGLESIYLEDSWVVGICIDSTEVTFDLEVVLTETQVESQDVV